MPLLPPFRGFRAVEGNSGHSGRDAAFVPFRAFRAIPHASGRQRGRIRKSKKKRKRDSFISIIKGIVSFSLPLAYIILLDSSLPSLASSIALHSPPLHSLRSSPSMPSVALHSPPSPPLQSQRQRNTRMGNVKHGLRSLLEDSQRAYALPQESGHINVKQPG